MPIWLYVSERDDGVAVVSYYRLSAIVAAYGKPGLQEFGQELDAVLSAMVHLATK